MSGSEAPSRTRLLRAGTVAVLVASAAGVSAYAFLRPPAADLAARPVAPVPPPAAAVPTPGAPPAPAFDVVRISPSGTAVLAGRAEAGARVIVRDGGQPLGEARADSRGEWVLLPAAPLTPGGRELTVASRMPGQAEVRGDSVLLSVPTPSAPAVAAAVAAPLPVLLMPGVGPPRILGAPDPGTRAAGTALGLATVDYDDRGGIRFAGTARPGAPVRVYVDNAPAGEAVADPLGRWAITPQADLAAGLHRLRVDQVAATGRVQARVEVPFQRSSMAAAELAGGRVVVQPGQTLWRLARAAYGAGVRYTVIYLANREQIRDPRLIYPGQTFSVPDAAPQP